MIKFSLLKLPRLLGTTLLLSCAGCLSVAGHPDGHTQGATTTRLGSLTRPEYAILNPYTFIFRVSVDGRLNALKDDPDNPIGDSSLAHYGPQILELNGDGSTVYIGGQIAQSGVANADEARIDAYHLSAQGRLRRITTFARQTDGHPYALTFGRDGRFLYVLASRKTLLGESSSLTGYRVSRSGRVTRLPSVALSLGPGDPGDPGEAKSALISDVRGRFVYASHSPARSVRQYRVAADGSLRPLSPAVVSLPFAPARMISPRRGPFFYLFSLYGNRMVQMRAGADGTLRRVRSFQLGGLNTYRSVVVTPDGRFLYVGGAHSVIGQYVVGPDGQMRPLLPPAAVFYPGELKINLDGHFLYVIGGGQNNQVFIQPYQIGPSGVLVRIKGNPTATAGNVSLAFAHPSR